MNTIPLIPFTESARKATNSAVKCLHYPKLAREDYEDMSQEAEIALWLHRDRPFPYAFTAAKGEARHHYWRYVLEYKRKDGSPVSALPQDLKIHIPLGEEGDELLPGHAEADDDAATKLSPEMIAVVTARLAAKYGIGSRGMKRYVQVLQLICEGQRSNDAIARELGLPSAEAARHYRTSIRAVLRELLTQQVLGHIEQSS